MYAGFIWVIVFKLMIFFKIILELVDRTHRLVAKWGQCELKFYQLV